MIDTNENFNTIKKINESSKSQIIPMSNQMRRLSTLKKEYKQTKLNTWEIIKYLVCFKFDKIKKRISYIDSFYEILSINFDLIFTIKSQIEAELFKSVILNKEQNDVLTVSFRKRNDKKMNVMINLQISLAILKFFIVYFLLKF